MTNLRGKLVKEEKNRRPDGGIIMAKYVIRQAYENITPIFKQELKTKESRHNPMVYLARVCAELGTKVSDIQSEQRPGRLSCIRALCYCVLHEHFGLSLAETGKFLGPRDHTTVLAGIRRIPEDIKEELRKCYASYTENWNTGDSMETRVANTLAEEAPIVHK